ncbi:MAG: putative Na+/H+ antiporter [Oligoflexales bacterium]
MVEMRYVATTLFVCAIVHTFCTKRLLNLASRYPSGSMQENLFHFLGEVEVVFGLWAALFIGIWSIQSGTDSAAHYLSEIDYTEAAFVFVIMCMAATRPVLHFAERLIDILASALPFGRGVALYCTCLIFGPLLGSLITEPAAMTVTAILLRDRFFTGTSSLKFRYATLGLLFVNVSIGGTLTHFAAPPVLMVAEAWNWDTPFMITTFGWRAAIAVSTGTILTALVFRKELVVNISVYERAEHVSMPAWVIAVHLAFLLLTISNVHYMSFFIPLFLLFLGWCSVAKEYQEELRIRESLLVGFFLGGLVTLGKMQDWWLQPLLSSLSETPMFWGALSLTAVTDNAALTYLGSLVPNLSMAAKYALVSGAVAGGGLTVIANAPNPAGYGLLRDSFGTEGISPLGLFLGALPYTLIAAAAFAF